MKHLRIEKLKALLPTIEQFKDLSKDRSTKIGVFIIDDSYTVRSMGYNNFPRGIDDNVEARHERPEKYYWTEHAERNSIYNAVRCHTDIRGCYMLMTCGIPCMECARAIIQVGIKGIICPSITGPKVWKGHEEHTIRSLELFQEVKMPILLLETNEYLNAS